jgi:hypothetical protein
MENLACALFVFSVYCLWACASLPSVNTAVDPAETPVDYFPDVEEVTPEPIQEVQEEVTPAIAVEPAKKPSTLIPGNLENLSIRQLKKLASAAKLPKYSSLTKAQLIDRLTSLEVEAIARKAA